jgi:transformation/transcription domain-associated protein
LFNCKQDGFTFCTTLNPRLFSIDLTVQEHQIFYQELLSICEQDDTALSHLPCYKNVQSLIPLRKSGMAALAACNYIRECRKPIFDVLWKLLDSDKQEIAIAAESSMKKFLGGQQGDIEQIHASLRSALSKLSDYRQMSLQSIEKLHRLMSLFPSSFSEKLCETLLSHLRKWMEAATVAVNAKPLRRNGELQEVKICSAILDTFHLVPSASLKLLEPLVSLALSGERVLMLEIGSPFRDPLFKFLCCHPEQAVEYFTSHLADPQTQRLFTFLLRRPDAQPLRNVLEQHPSKLISRAFDTSDTELQYQGILITRCLVKFNKSWLMKPEQKDLVTALRNLWTSDEFQQKAGKPGLQWKEPKYLVKCLLSYIRHHHNDVELLFQVLRVFTSRYMPSFHFLKDFLEQEVSQGYSIEERRQIFFKFVELFCDSSFPDEVKAKALQFILIPVFTTSFGRGHKELLLGDPPIPDQDRHDDLVSIFVEQVIDCDHPLAAPDALRIMLLQFSALLVDQASEYVHDPSNKMQKQGSKLRRLTAYAWPCLLNKQCEDPATRYHGHLLLAHIIAKFAINKKIVLQVFHSLLRAHAVEARGVIRQALEVLTPAIPARMDDGNTVLLHWTKKIIVEEGHTVAQLVHILQLVVRHYKVYYPVRGYLFQYMTNFMQKLGFPPNATIEYRRLAVDLAEVIIKWEMQRIKSDNEHQAEQTAGSDVSTSVVPASQGGSPAQVSGMKRAGEELIQDPKRQKTASGALVRQVTVATRHVLEKHHQDAVVNFLIRIACQVSDQNSATSSGSPGEILSRRCVALLKTALRPDVWPVVELKLAWFEKLLLTVASQASQASQQDQTPNHFPNVCTALEILTLLLSVVHRPAILAMLKPLQRGLVLCMSSDSNKVIRGVHNFLAKLMSLFPTESSTASVSSKYDELEGLYSNVSRVIFEGLQTYERSTTSGGSTTTGLYGTLMMLKAACSHNVCYIDRFISLFMKVLSKMQHEHLSPTEESSIPVMTDMMTLSVELMKTRIPVMSQEMRKNFITLLSTLIEKSSEVRLLRAITKIVEEWIKNKTQLPVQQAPSLREKYHLLYRMMNSYEKRFPNEQELNAQFLDLVYHVFKEDAFQGSELTSKLESAFLAGLRCNQPHVRGKFVQLLDYHLPRELHQRLLYIVQTQNWEFIGPHFWIKQCIELVLAVADGDQPILPASETQSVRDEPFQGSRIVDVIESMETELSLSRNRLKLLKARHEKFLSNAGMVKSSSFVDGVVQLCHEDTSLAFHIWLELFPQTWNLLTEQNLQIISREISPFLCSGAHLTQVDCHPSSIEAFVEAFLRCKPMFCLRPAVLKYIGKNHNLWHQSCLCLEEHVYDCDDLSPQLQAETQEQHKQSREGLQHTISDGDLFGTMRDERLDCLSELYSVLKEDDMWAGLWHKRCRFKETSKAILFEQQGLFEQSQTSYEKAMAIAREEHNHGPQHPAARPEYRLWRDHWLRCCKELGQWSLMTDLGRNRLHPDPYLGELALRNLAINCLILLKSDLCISLEMHAMYETPETSNLKKCPLAPLF